MSLQKRLTTIGGILGRAEEPEYDFEPEDNSRSDPNIIEYPSDSPFDVMLKTFRGVSNMVVTLQADLSETQTSLISFEQQQRDHAVEIWRELDKAGVFSALADTPELADFYKAVQKKLADAPPPALEGDEE